MWKSGSTLSHPIPKNKLRLRAKSIIIKALEDNIRASLYTFRKASKNARAKALKETVDNFDHVKI
jgi:hypothetical protein